MYDGTSPDGYGSFICEYMPLATVETLITESSRIYDEMQERERINFGRAYRTEDVRRMAAVATRFLLNDLQRAISEALTEAFLDARLIAEAVLVMGVAEGLEPVMLQRLFWSAKEHRVHSFTLRSERGSRQTSLAQLHRLSLIF